MSVLLRRRTGRKRRSPSSVPGLIAWGVAADRSELADGGQVGTITDRVGGFAYTSTTASERPLFRPNGIGGKPALQFVGASRARLVSPSMTIPATWSFWAVTQRTSTDGGGAAAAISADIAGARIAQCGWTGGNTTRAVGFVNTSPVIDAGPNLSFGVPAVMLSTGQTPAANNTARVQHIVNGVLGDPTFHTSAAALTGGTAPIVIARSGAQSPAYLDGLVAEWGVFDHALDPFERSTLHSYVQDNYGISVADYVAA